MRWERALDDLIVINKDDKLLDGDKECKMVQPYDDNY
jgi:hypothetical protein